MCVCLFVTLALYYEEKNLLLSPLAETWCKFWGAGSAR